MMDLGELLEREARSVLAEIESREKSNERHNNNDHIQTVVQQTMEQSLANFRVEMSGRLKVLEGLGELIEMAKSAKEDAAQIKGEMATLKKDLQATKEEIKDEFQQQNARWFKEKSQQIDTQIKMATNKMEKYFEEMLQKKVAEKTEHEITDAKETKHAATATLREEEHKQCMKESCEVLQKMEEHEIKYGATSKEAEMRNAIEKTQAINCQDGGGYDESNQQHEWFHRRSKESN
jgi:hypothetical protein